jgi:hypothetical protein
MYARRLSQAAKRNALQRRCEIDPLSGTSCTSVDDYHMSLPRVELDNINPGHLLDSVVRNSEIRRDRFNFPMPTKMPTNWTDGANFLSVFSMRLENFSKNMESN